MEELKKTNAQRLNEIKTNLLFLVSNAQKQSLNLNSTEKQELESIREFMDILYYDVFYK